jgi:hypothetical protein
VYSKGVVDTMIAAKATANTVYTKTESDARYYLKDVTLNSITAPGGHLSMNNYKISSLANGTLANDAVTKS